LLDRLTAKAQSEFPISVRLQVHDCEADILLGLPESFVYLNEVGPMRYYVTLGDSNVDGVVSFHLLGQHHTEFERRHLIAAAIARQVLREFFDTGRRSTSVDWEEGVY
jgi:Immunity protein Imm1